MTRLLFFFSAFIFCSSFSVMKDDGTVKSILTGKKISETPFNEYIKEELKGDQVILFIAYGCPHCWDATAEIRKLKNAGLIDNIIVLGSEAGETGAKKKFIENAGPDFNSPLIDYDWATFPKKFTGPEPSFPQPPLAIYVHENVIMKIFTKMPDVESFRKIKKEG